MFRVLKTFLSKHFHNPPIRGFMNQMEQAAVFTAAKKSLSSEIHPRMLSWSYEDMLGEIRRVAESIRVKGERKPLRYFARHQLGLRGDNIERTVSGWLRRGEPMSESDIVTVMRVLSKLHGPIDSPDFSEKSKGIARQFVSFIIMSLSKILGILSGLGTRPDHIDEGDRIELRRILKDICARLGIDVVFPEDMTNLTPVSRRELAKIGLPSKVQQKEDQ